MPQKVLKFTGINRVANEFQNSGACEELINLRSTQGGNIRTVKNKVPILTDVPYELIYEHAWGEYVKYIAVRSDCKVVSVDIETKKETVLTDQFTSNDIEISSAGNVLTLYSKADEKILVYKYENDAYESYEVDLPIISDVRVTYEYNNDTELPPHFKATSSVENVGLNVTACNRLADEAIQKAVTGFYATYPRGLCGTVLIGCTYELKDGTEIWSTAFTVADITRFENYVAPELVQIGQINSLIQIGATVSGAKEISFQFSYVNDESDFPKLDNIKRFNIYATRPVFKYEADVSINFDNNTDTGLFNYGLKENKLSKLELSKQLMYYQGSFTPDESSITTLNFGKSQAGEALMPVTAGCINRIGPSKSYNNRFHFYDSSKYHIIQNPTVSSSFSISNGSQMTYLPENSDKYSRWIAYVKINNKWILINRQYFISQTIPCDFVYPMADVEELAFVKGNLNAYGYLVVPYSEMFYVDLKSSEAYNYSYAFDVTPRIVSAEQFGMDMMKANQHFDTIGEYTSEVLMEKEENVINVSAPLNPNAFQVENSYSFGGNIIDMATSYIPVSSTQIGQYPLTVFTSNGIFIMEQGNGTTLYDSIVPILPNRIEGKVGVTPYGTFFVSSRNLYMLIGREAIHVSGILNGQRELMVRGTQAYQQLYCSGTNGFHNYTDDISGMDFEDFITNTRFSYDQFNNELIVSSNDEQVKYSYVFNLATKSYHKIPKKYRTSQNGAKYAIEESINGRDVVDIHSEQDSDNQPVFLQSRPLSLEVLYTHIQRLLLFADAELTPEQNLTISVFASDNLHDWKCIITSQKRNTILRQIRTNKAAKSYREYIIVISGVVDTNTDISDIIADYTIVQRRLG